MDLLLISTKANEAQQLEDTLCKLERCEENVSFEEIAFSSFQEEDDNVEWKQMCFESPLAKEMLHDALKVEMEYKIILLKKEIGE